MYDFTESNTVIALSLVCQKPVANILFWFSGYLLASPMFLIASVQDYSCNFCVFSCCVAVVTMPCVMDVFDFQPRARIVVDVSKQELSYSNLAAQGTVMLPFLVVKKRNTNRASTLSLSIRNAQGTQR